MRDAPAVDDQSRYGRLLRVLDLDTAVRPLDRRRRHRPGHRSPRRTGVVSTTTSTRSRLRDPPPSPSAIPEQGQQRATRSLQRHRSRRSATAARIARLVVDLTPAPPRPRPSRPLGRARPAPCMQRIERRAIVVEVLAVQDVLGQVRREPERVVELEDHVSRARPSTVSRGAPARTSSSRSTKAPPQRASGSAPPRA